MFKILRRIPKSRLAFFSFFAPSTADTVTTPGYEDLEKKYYGVEALKKMFESDEYGAISPELTTAVHMSATSLLVGLVYGAIRHGRVAFANFIENNQATQFVNHIDAKKKLQDQITLAMGRGAIKWGTKIGLFSTMFIMLHTTMRVYRGGPGILEYVAAGTLTGGFFRLSLGPKGFVVGALVGGVIGTVAGAASQTILYMSGYTMQDIEKAQHQFHLDRNEAVRNSTKATLQTDEETRKLREAQQEEKLTKSLPFDKIPDLKE